MIPQILAVLIQAETFHVSRDLTLSLVIFFGVTVFALLICLPMYRSARARDAMQAQAAESRELKARINELERHLDEERLLNEGYEDQVARYQGTMSDLLSGMDVAAAFFGRDGRLMAWTDQFQDSLEPSGGHLERGLSFETILPVSQLFGGQGEKAVTAPYLDGVAREWTTALHQTPSGVLLSARCRQVPQGWIVSLLDDGSAREVGAMQEALDAAEADLQRFLYIAGHDLRAPLRALKTLPGWISEEIEASFGPPDADLAEYIEELEIQAERMDRLLLDVLTFSRIGRRGDPARETDTEALLDEVTSAILPESFGLTVDGALPDLTAQPNEVMLLLQCLLSNVVKHHDRDRGRIKITTQRGFAGLTLKVEDDGPGIDPRFREKVFEMFSTLKPRDEVEGSGIGLAMVRKIVDLWGGSVVLEDSDLGGLCVRIDLPSPFEHTKAAA